MPTSPGPASAPDSGAPAGGLKRALGVGTLTFYGIGIIIGAGIYSVIGAAAGVAEEGLWASFLVAALVAGFTAFAYAELSAAIPVAGAEFTYLSRALPRMPLVPFVIAVVVALAAVATAGTVALAFAGYLREFLPGFPTWLGAGSLLLACTFLNIWGIRESGWVNAVFAVIEVAGLLLIVTLGLQAPGFGSGAIEHLSPAVFAGAAVVFFVYLGFEDLANLAEEARDPGRDLPRAVFWSLGVTTLLYIMVALAVVTLVTPEALAGSSAPLATAAATRGPVWATTLSWIALCATANTALITLVGVSRFLYGVAKTGAISRALASTLPTRQTPYIAALVAFGGSLALLPFGTVAMVAGLSSFASLMAFLAVNCAAILLRRLEPELKRPFRMPFAIRGVPVLPVLGALATLALMTRFEPIVYGSVLGLMALGALGYRVSRKAAPPLNS